jgi:hypothetical protein
MDVPRVPASFRVAGNSALPGRTAPPMAFAAVYVVRYAIGSAHHSCSLRAASEIPTLVRVRYSGRVVESLPVSKHTSLSLIRTRSC